MSARVCGTWRTPGCWRGLRKPGSNSPWCHAHGSDSRWHLSHMGEARHICPSPLGLEKLPGEAASSKAGVRGWDRRAPLTLGPWQAGANRRGHLHSWGLGPRG